MGPNSPGLGDYYTYDFATRSTGAGGTNVTPTIRLVDKYQLLSTGDYAPPMVKTDAADKESVEMVLVIQNRTRDVIIVYMQLSCGMDKKWYVFLMTE